MAMGTKSFPEQIIRRAIFNEFGNLSWSYDFGAGTFHVQTMNVWHRNQNIFTYVPKWHGCKHIAYVQCACACANIIRM